MLDITIGIMSYNRPQFLEQAVISSLNQSVKPSKIIIFDNGSDEAVKIGMEKYLVSGVEWAGADANRGFFWNFERAFAACNTKYLILLHDDDRLLHNFLERQMEWLILDPEITALSCNGYFIDANNVRFGQTLSPLKSEKELERYKTPSQIAIKYASNSCIPLSPTIYKVSNLLNLNISSEYGKVADAVFFCRLAQNGVVALNPEPLYEVRFHGGQDSQFIPFDQAQRLEDFFWEIPCANIAERNFLRQHLIRQHSIRNVKLIVHHARTFNFKSVFALLIDKRFNFISALKSIFQYCFRDYRLNEHQS